MFHAAQAALLAIPGHAQYYRDRILKAREEYEHTPPEMGPHPAKLVDEQRQGFGAMAHLPSVETVRVLGEFLADERGEIGGPGKPPMVSEGRSMEPSNSSYALQSLHTLPLANKPVTAPHVYYDSDLETYRRWFARIKSGNATFRFEGDPTEYDLAGPAPPEKLKRIAAARQRDEQRSHRQQTAAGTADPATTAPAPSTSGGKALSRTPALFAILAVLAAGAWYFLRRRNSPPT
ncbi:MAG: hypothetical protein K9N23_23560 [Akkermansiaceae bacterium]|nr:hypothetical protein [Akkermansiaceae bacterium]